MSSKQTLNLGLRWIAGVALMLLVRLLLEERLPSGAAMGLGFAVFLAVWLPTVPAEAYRAGSPHRKVLISRYALFFVAAVVSGILYPLTARWPGRS